MYMHYLDGHGEDYVFDFNQAYYDDPSIRKDIEDEIWRAQLGAEELATLLGVNKFQMTGVGTNIPYNPETEEWHKTIGSYNIWSSADVFVTGDTITMRITVHAEDRYNFNEGAHDIVTGEPDASNGRFATLGWAQPFNSSGVLVRDVTWKIGSSGTTTSMREPWRPRW